MTSSIISDRKIAIALTLYLTALFATNTVGIKVMPFFYGHLSTSIFVFPIVFITTDVIGEVYGKQVARLFVLMGSLSLIFFLAANLLSNLMPASPDFFLRDAYDQIFSLSFRFSAASLVAYVLGEYQDVLSFFYFTAKMGGRAFWLRSNLSNLWGQAVDTVVWFTIAMGGVYPLPVFLRMMATWWLFKVIAGFFFTPLSYVGIRLLRGDSKARAVA